MTPGILHPFETPPKEGAATEIAEGVLWMRLPLPMALDHVNVYALDDGGSWTIVDTGVKSRRSIAVWETLLAGPLAAKPVNRLIITHHHPDHIGLAGWFQARGTELLATRTAWLYARMLVLDEQAAPTPETMLYYTRAGVSEAMMAKKSTERPFNFCDIVAPMPQGFTRIAEGSRITAANRRWQVRFGQGHAPDHATLWSMDDNLVLGGDQLLPGISANIGVYPTEPEADPLAEWLRSITEFAPFARIDQLVLPGHKLPFTGLPLRLIQMAENHETALKRLLAHLASPRVATDCFVALFKREIGHQEFGLALVEAIAHLNFLLRRGDISRSLNRDGAWAWQASQEPVHAQTHP